jgi:hypothetical protein
MNEQQITSQDEKRQKSLAIHHKISKVLFIIFIILFCTMLLSRFYFDILPHFFIFFITVIFMWLLFPAYFFYLIISTIFNFANYRTILKFNAIAISILVIFATISSSGFCYKEKRFLSQSEIIDSGLEYAIKNCKKEADVPCPTTLATLKETYPQCFGQNLSDKCVVQIEYYSQYLQEVRKIKYTIYKMETYTSTKDILIRLLFLPLIQTWGSAHKFSTNIYFSDTSNGFNIDACGR